MKISGHWLRQAISAGIIVCLAAPCGEAAIVRLQQKEDAHAIQAQSANSVSANKNPAADPTQSKASPDGSASTSAPTNPNPQSSTLPPTQSQPQNNASQPVGTAAAPYEKTQGIPASRPAGAVMAPAKQRRTRSFLIRVSVIVGAAIAIGTVAALSKGSPSRPQ
jgi:cytoskeletal protein RodZ